MGSCSIQKGQKTLATFSNSDRSPPLSGSNVIPFGKYASSFKHSSMFGRLNSSYLFRNDSACQPHSSSVRKDVMNPSQFMWRVENTAQSAPHSNLNLDLNLALNRNYGPMSTTFPVPQPGLGWWPYTRCLSNTQSRPTCRNSIRCTSCFRLGHFALLCRFLPRFLGLPLSGSLPSFPCASMAEHMTYDSWFQYPAPLTIGPSPSGPPTFHSFGQLSQVLFGIAAAAAPSSIAWKPPAPRREVPAQLQ